MISRGLPAKAIDKARAAGQGDMLLPISGVRMAAQAAKKTPSQATKLKNVARKVV